MNQTLGTQFAPPLSVRHVRDVRETAASVAHAQNVPVPWTVAPSLARDVLPVISNEPSATGSAHALLPVLQQSCAVQFRLWVAWTPRS